MSTMFNMTEKKCVYNQRVKNDKAEMIKKIFIIFMRTVNNENTCIK